ncbi:hypothetical protein BN3661_02194 [Eubacteriaceae bacterium CHKCI005]|nr:hypothetical protein BN3661_02194 [Eubacteriaceae bacterium CHKCI005]
MKTVKIKVDVRRENCNCDFCLDVRCKKPEDIREIRNAIENYLVLIANQEEGQQ